MKLCKTCGKPGKFYENKGVCIPCLLEKRRRVRETWTPERKRKNVFYTTSWRKRTRELKDAKSLLNFR